VCYYKYVISVFNAGPSTARDFSIGDAFPGVFTGPQQPQDFTVSGGGFCFFGNDIGCTWYDIAVGQTVTVTMPFTVTGDVAAGAVENCVYDSNDRNNRISLSTMVAVESDLSVTKTDNVDNVTAGDLTTYTYTIVGTNNGPSSATNVTFTDTWPIEFTRGTVTALFASVSYNTEDFTVVYPQLNPGDSYTFSVSYVVDASVLSASATNTVCVSSTRTDPCASDSTTIIRAAAVAISLTGPASVYAGDTSRAYTVIVTNSGPSLTQSVRIADTIPALFVPSGLPPVTDASTSCTYTGGGALDCTVTAPIPPGQSVQVVFMFDVPAVAAAGTVTNTAFVSTSLSKRDSGTIYSSALQTTVFAASLSGTSFGSE
jgi:uncharacterized repeat protein (TIGR01451 family)